MNLQYNDDSRPMRLSAAYAHSGHCEMRRSEALFAGIPTVLLGQHGVDIGPAEAGCPSGGRYLTTPPALVVEPGAGRFQVVALMSNTFVCRDDRQKSIEGRKFRTGCVINSCHQTKCHLLIESATDETPAEAMLPPPEEPFLITNWSDPLRAEV